MPMVGKFKPPNAAVAPYGSFAYPMQTVSVRRNAQILKSVLKTAVGAPKEILVTLVSVAIFLICLVTVNAIAKYGYPRPFWTHRSVDLNKISVWYARRLLRASLTVSDAIRVGGRLVDDLMTSYPALRQFAETGVGDRHDIAQRVAATMFDGRRAHAMVGRAWQLSQGPDVATVLKKHSDGIRSGDVGILQQTCACAIAEARLIASKIPGLARIRDTRTKKMDVIENVQFFVRGDADAYSAMVLNNFKQARDLEDESYRVADRVFDSIQDTAVSLAGGGSREQFVGKIAKAIIKPFTSLFKALIKPFVSGLKIIVGLVKTFVKLLGVSSKIIIRLFNIFTRSIEDIAKLLELLLKGFATLVNKLTTEGVLPALVFLCRMAIGVVLYIWASVTQSLIKLVVSVVWLYCIPCLITLFHTAVFAVVVVAKSLIGVVDNVTGGSVRFLASTESDPDDWWKRPAFDRGNAHSRSIVTWSPCYGPFVPSSRGLYCEPCESGVPMYAPQALIATRYFNGRFPMTSKSRVDRRAEPLKAYAAITRRAQGTMDAYAKDLVGTLVTCNGCIGTDASMVEVVHRLNDVGYGDPRSSGDVRDASGDEGTRRASLVPIASLVASSVTCTVATIAVALRAAA